MSKGTFDVATVPTPFDGVDAGEWQALVARGAATGVLHADAVAHVLRKVELTPDVLLGVKSTLEALGIAVDEGIDELPDDEMVRRDFGSDRNDRIFRYAEFRQFPLRLDLGDGWKCSWLGPLENQFPGVSVDVVILMADRVS